MPLTLMRTDAAPRTDSLSASSFAGQRLHFIGIGGCGMSGLAAILLDAGAVVSGSDLRPSLETERLARRGARIVYQQNGTTLGDDIDLVVRTAAVRDDNAEFRRARELHLPHLKYAQLLGQVMAERCGIAVAGTHGKTTTTSMLAFALRECGLDPSFVIGGQVPQLDGSSHSGRGNAFVVEACEYDRSFHNLHPRIAIVTNIDADHLDCYRGGLPEIRQSFRVFADGMEPGGTIIASGQDANSIEALAGMEVEWTGCGLGNPKSEIRDLRSPTWSTRITGIENGCYHGEVRRLGEVVAELHMATPGEHNLNNATQALAAAVAAGADPVRAAEAIGRFEGAARRMTRMGSYRGATVIDDYGHHPTELQATLGALRQSYRPARLIVAFQPHQYSRTRLLLNEFAESFADADVALIPDIYAVRDSDEDRRAVSSADLVAAINAHGRLAHYIPSMGGILDWLRREAREGDLIVTQGAGDIWTIARDLVQKPQ